VDGAGAGPDGADAEALWLHAWRYSCDAPAHAFRVEAPPPPWAEPFLPLTALDNALEVLAAAAASVTSPR